MRSQIFWKCTSRNCVLPHSLLWPWLSWTQPPVRQAWPVSSTVVVNTTWGVVGVAPPSHHSTTLAHSAYSHLTSAHQQTCSQEKSRLNLRPQKHLPTETSAHQNISQQKRPPTKTSAHQNIHPPNHPPTKISAHQNFRQPKRPATKTSGHQNIYQPKHLPTKTSTHQNIY